MGGSCAKTAVSTIADHYEEGVPGDDVGEGVGLSSGLHQTADIPRKEKEKDSQGGYEDSHDECWVSGSFT